MELTGRVVRQISLISLFILIAPMVLFPDRLGTELARVSLINALYELVYYGLVAYFFFHCTSLHRIVQVAGLCLVYRLLLGTVFGLFIAVVYSMNLTASVTLGMSSYLPAIFLHIAVTPFILKPVVVRSGLTTKSPHKPTEAPAPREVKSYRNEVAPVAVEQRAVRPTPTHTHKRETPMLGEVHADSSLSPGLGEANGFDRAARYIGEDGSVLLAAVVDHEGLVLGRFLRGDAVADDWAPFSLLFYDVNRATLQRAGWSSPEKIDLVVKDKKIVVARETSWCLMVVAERRADNLLNIRINKGLEMIRKHIAQRYGQKLSVNAEKIYVSST